MLAFSIAFYWCPGRHLLKHMLTRLTLGKVLRATLKQSSTSSLTQTVAELRASRASSCYCFEYIRHSINWLTLPGTWCTKMRCSSCTRRAHYAASSRIRSSAVILAESCWFSRRGLSVSEAVGAQSTLMRCSISFTTWSMSGPNLFGTSCTFYQTLFAQLTLSSSAMILNNWLINPTGEPKLVG
jgi:hypothetical protein